MNFDLRSFSPENLADELTLMNKTLFLKIRPDEIEHFRFCSAKKKVFAPNVCRLFDFFDRISLLFATQILKHFDEKSRVDVIVHLFVTIRHLYLKNHDIHSIRMILATFDHPAVFRLRKTWRKFRRENPKFYTALKYLWNVLGQNQNWNEYQIWLEEKFVMDSLKMRRPMLIFIGFLLTKLVNDYDRYFSLSNNEETKANRKYEDKCVHPTLIQLV